MSVTVAILGLVVLIILHELGHYAAAKATGMRVLRFFLFFPPTLVSRRFGETEYGVGWIPLGGYVKIPGMLRPEPGDLFEVEDLLERGEALPPERAAAIAEAHDDVRRELGRSRVDAAQAAVERLRAELHASAEWMSARDRRRTERAVDRVAESLDPRSYWRSSLRARLIVIAAGPLANILVAFVLLAGIAMTGKPNPPIPTDVVAAVQEDSPAAEAGLRVGDRIVSVDGRAGDPEDFRAAIQASGGRPVAVTVRRDGRRVALAPAAPRMEAGAYRLGFVFGSRVAPTTSYGPIESMRIAGEDIWRMTTGTFGALGDIGSSEGRSQLSGPIGIVRYSADAADIGLPYYLTLAALVSLSLAIFNLLPFLPLDGGHIALVVLERIRGRAISRPAFERVSALGIVLMLVVFVIGLQNDIGGLTGTQP